MSKRKKELEHYYRETTYSVFIENKQYEINIEKPLPPAIQELINIKNSAVILTAWNPRSQVLSLSENTSRNSVLRSKLNKYTVFNAVGQGNDLDWPAEESFFIIGLEQEEADMLAIEYEQYAYVWLEINKKASLVFTKIWHSLHSDS